MGSILFNILQLTLKKFVKSTKVKKTSGLSQEESGSYGINFIKHSVVVNRQFFKNPH
jgi:hypothetical protein